MNSSSTEDVNDENALTPLQLSWNSYLSISNMIPNLGMLLLNATIGHKVPMRPRLIGALLGIIILFICTDVLTKVNTDNFQDGFLSLTLATVVLITSCVGILQVMLNSKTVLYGLGTLFLLFKYFKHMIEKL